MPEANLFQQSRSYRQFECIGATCDDTCCSGWQVSVDRTTYEKYQACTHPAMRPRLDRWIQIQPDPVNDNTFARIHLEKSTCPFLSENLCSIQTELGRDYLSRTCATFPRVRNNVGGVIERSLDLSCPEAARLCLTDPSPAAFDQVAPDPRECEDLPVRLEIPDQCFWEIRSAMLTVLQNRAFPVAKRLILVGHMCAKLDELLADGQQASIPQTLEGFGFGIGAGFYREHLKECSANAADQLSLVLELMTARIKLDFVPQRYMDHYREFVEGLRLRPGISVHECSDRYIHASKHQYLPFMGTHEYMLEHYLIYYAYRTLFPFSLNRHPDNLETKVALGSFTKEYMLMAATFGMIHSMIIALAARHGLRFDVDHVVRCLQSSSKALEHCTSYPAQVLQILTSKGIVNAAGMSVLTQDPA